MGGGVVAKAFVEAYKQGMINAQRTGAATQTARKAVQKMMTRQEAQQILGVKEHDSINDMMQRYARLAEANDPGKGGSPYLRAKIDQAKEAVIKSS
eukprot:CAMPEP_0196655902 /NCGR_PEP_ID=MMETSP1086-20130531/10351_1 /TAXON_ID=77921 /ORGANISM="Cyanoptyche  gloeocystis , Strain SAG4.97" /LENGTH=95 /DNA_ID=CAMNT_0041988435 /DNA_START=58 /DNA_END=345 /DNA_ORIENTATION=+